MATNLSAAFLFAIIGTMFVLAATLLCVCFFGGASFLRWFGEKEADNANGEAGGGGDGAGPALFPAMTPRQRGFLNCLAAVAVYTVTSAFGWTFLPRENPWSSFGTYCLACLAILLLSAFHYFTAENPHPERSSEVTRRTFWACLGVGLVVCSFVLPDTDFALALAVLEHIVEILSARIQGLAAAGFALGGPGATETVAATTTCACCSNLQSLLGSHAGGSQPTEGVTTHTIAHTVTVEGVSTNTVITTVWSPTWERMYAEEGREGH
ncbi:hypothetical protein TWF481_004959 [Arthrobotrys musiformis]|uniref:MARVEL domain-containing protein n=1 Tax=Arthrobotrys musiformis TaxID=47236 RepID=A0AAV9WL70_9PEZI